METIVVGDSGLGKMVADSEVGEGVKMDFLPPWLRNDGDFPNSSRTIVAIGYYI